MKKYIKGLSAAALCAVMLTSCGDDYLQTIPQTSISTEEAASEMTYIGYMVNGIYKTLSTQYLSSQGWNGVGTDFLYMNSDPSGTVIHSNGTDWVVNGTNNTNANNNYGQYIYMIWYRMIMNANNVIDALEDFDPGEDKALLAQKQYYLGEALTMRAYGYVHLIHMFSRRWSESRNGESRGVVLRTTARTSEDLPCSSQNEVFAQIYEDLDNALQNFAASGLSRSEKWHVNADVAHTVYANAALWKEDWATAASHAQAARQNYPLMGNDWYHAGFCDESNPELMWYLFNSSQNNQNLFYYSYFAYAASNSSSSACRTNPYLIDKLLYESIPDTDSRKDLYIVPTREEWDETNNTGSYQISRSTLQASAGQFYVRAHTAYADRIYETSNVYAYMQTKILLQEQPGIGQLYLARAGEMYYAEAEAQYKLGNTAQAQQILEAVVKPYDPNYTCTLTGDALYKEIKKYRQFDLFLEGQALSDEKRWGEPRVRVEINTADPMAGGNWRTKWAGTTGIEEMNHWCWVLGRQEVDYNEFISNNVEPDNWSVNDPSTW